jgi:hypothetical protein
MQSDETEWPWQLSRTRLNAEISEARVRIERSIDVTLLVGDLLTYENRFAMVLLSVKL